MCMGLRCWGNFSNTKACYLIMWQLWPTRRLWNNARRVEFTFFWGEYSKMVSIWSRDFINIQIDADDSVQSVHIYSLYRWKEHILTYCNHETDSKSIEYLSRNYTFTWCIFHTYQFRGENIRAEYCPRENIQAVQTAVIDKIDMGDNMYFGLNIAHVRTPPPIMSDIRPLP